MVSCWKETPLKEDIILISGRHILADDVCEEATGGEGVPYLTGPADFVDGQIRATKFALKPDVISSPGDILLTVKGSGTGTVVRADKAYCISRQIMAIRPKTWNADFLHCVLKSLTLKYRNSAAGLIPGISRIDILNTRILVPPIHVQEYIGNIDRLYERNIRQLSNLISAKLRLKRGLMQQLLTGKRRFGEFVRSWRETTLADIAEVNPGRLNGLGGDTTVTFLGMSDIAEGGGIIFRHKRRLEEVNKGYTPFLDGDILVAKITPCFENLKGALVDGLLHKCGFGSTEFHVLRVTDTCDPIFIYHVTMSDRFRQTGTGSMSGSAGQKRIPRDFVKGYRFQIPSLTEQRRIAAVLSAADNEINLLRRKLELLKKQKRGLMQKLLTGKVRVKV